MGFQDFITRLNKAEGKVQLVNGCLELYIPAETDRLSLMAGMKEHEATLIEFLTGGDSHSTEPIYPAPQQDHYELSHAQRRLWILHQLEGSESAYNIPLPYIIEGSLDRHALNEAFESLVMRHESLRTTFVIINGEPRQKIHPANPPFFKMDYRDLREAADKEEQARSLALSEANRIFDLAAGPLMRVCLLQLGDEKYLLLLTLHHIISDGWSMEVLLKELLTLYDSLLVNGQALLPPLPLQYKDYACWQHAFLASEGAKEHQNYWSGQFKGELPILDLPADFSRPSQMNSQGEKIVALLKEPLIQNLRMISLQANASLFMTLMALVKTLLYRYTGLDDIIAGFPTAGRHHEDLEGQIGFYVNTLALRTRIADDDNFYSLIEKVRQQTLDAYEHQVYPFDLLVNQLKLERDVSRPPLFDIMVDLEEEQFTSDGEMELSGFRVGSYENDYKVAKFDLSISFSAAGDGMALSMTYNKSLFRKDRMERMLGHFIQLAESVIDDPEKPLHILEYLPAYERELLKNVFSGDVSNYARSLGTLAWFKTLYGPQKMAGIAAPDIKIYILDDHGQLLPIGVSGEIYLGFSSPDTGRRLHKDLDSEKIIPNTFLAGGILQRMGDSGRWLADGQIEYRGRKDDILLLKGYRIEAFQIRRELMKQEDILDAEILVLENGQGEKSLVAFYTATQPVEETKLKNLLNISLPGYMVPDLFRQLDIFPRTSTGDTDRPALLKTVRDNAAVTPEYEPPANFLEEQLQSIWSEVLGREKIGVLDNFFRITGNSIKATQIVARMYKLGYKVTIRSIFTCPSIRELAGLLSLSSANKSLQVPGSSLFIPA